MLLRQVHSTPVQLGFSHSIYFVKTIQNRYFETHFLATNRKWVLVQKMGSESAGHTNGILELWKKSYLFLSAYIDGLG